MKYLWRKCSKKESKYMDDKALIRIDSLLRHIDMVLSDIKDVSLDGFESNDLLFRATCFSITQIGEQMIRLQEKIGQKYPKIPWAVARKMRNFIVHDYDNVIPEIVYSTAKEDLPSLKESFLLIKKDYDN